MKKMTRIAWCVALCGAITAGAAAQQQRQFVREPPRGPSPLPAAEVLEQVDIDPELLRIVEQLDDATYQKRQEATVALSDAPFRNLDLYALLAREDLTPEQRHRMLQVIAERLLTRPRGAVGIQIDQRRLPDVVIFKLLPELPARDVLRIGDRITHLDGVPVAHWDTFRWAVQSRVPGTKISIRIERADAPAAPDAEADPEILDLQLVLGPAELLRDPNTGQPQSDGAFLAARKREVELASERFGGTPRPVEVVTGGDALAETPAGEPLFELEKDLPEHIRNRQNPGQ